MQFFTHFSPLGAEYSLSPPRSLQPAAEAARWLCGLAAYVAEKMEAVRRLLGSLCFRLFGHRRAGCIRFDRQNHVKA